MTDEKKHLSASAIGTYEKCAEAFRRQYVEHERGKVGVGAFVGSAVDHAVSLNMLAKLGGDVLSVDAVKALARDALVEKWQKDGAPMLTPEDGDEATAKGTAIDEAASLAALHHLEVAPLITPVAVQRKIRIALPGPYDLVGFIDVEEADCVRDTKTSGKSPDKDAAEKSTQLTIYDYARALEGKPSGTVRLDYLVKTKKPKYVGLKASRDSYDHTAMLRRVERVGAAIDAGAFPFTSPDSWACGQKYCSYWKRCDQGERKVVSVAMANDDSWME